MNLFLNADSDFRCRLVSLLRNFGLLVVSLLILSSKAYAEQAAAGDLLDGFSERTSNSALYTVFSEERAEEIFFNTLETESFRQRDPQTSLTELDSQVDELYWFLDSFYEHWTTVEDNSFDSSSLRQSLVSYTQDFYRATRVLGRVGANAEFLSFADSQGWLNSNEKFFLSEILLEIQEMMYEWENIHFEIELLAIR